MKVLVALALAVLFSCGYGEKLLSQEGMRMRIPSWARAKIAALRGGKATSQIQAAQAAKSHKDRLREKFLKHTGHWSRLDEVRERLLNKKNKNKKEKKTDSPPAVKNLSVMQEHTVKSVAAKKATKKGIVLPDLRGVPTWARNQVGANAMAGKKKLSRHDKITAQVNEMDRKLHLMPAPAHRRAAAGNGQELPLPEWAKSSLQNHLSTSHKAATQAPRKTEKTSLLAARQKVLSGRKAAARRKRAASGFQGHMPKWAQGFIQGLVPNAVF